MLTKTEKQKIDTILMSDFEKTLNEIENCSIYLVEQFYKLYNRLEPKLRQKTILDYVEKKNIVGGFRQ